MRTEELSMLLEHAALTGVLAGCDKQVDLFGVLVLAVVTLLLRLAGIRWTIGLPAFHTKSLPDEEKVL